MYCLRRFSGLAIFDSNKRLLLYSNLRQALFLKILKHRSIIFCYRVIDYPCFECDPKTNFTSTDQLVEHLSRCHRSAGESLRAMMLRRKRRRSGDNVTSDEARRSDESLLPPLSRICGVKNESGQDCFCIAGLHLLAQTDVFQRLTVHDHHSNCPAPSCLLAHFLETYCESKKRVVSSRPLVDHYDKVITTVHSSTFNPIGKGSSLKLRISESVRIVNHTEGSR